MQNLFIAASKYIILILMAIFIYQSFRGLKDYPKKIKNKIWKSQNAIMFVIHALSYIVIYIYAPTEKVIIFYGCQVIYFVLLIGISSILYERIHKVLLNNCCMFLCISFIILTRLSITQSISQFKIVVMATIITMFVPYLLNRMKFLKNITWVYAGLGLCLLAVVFVLGQISYGAKLSIDLGFISIQPSEFVKIIYVFFIASLLSKATNFKQVVISALFAGIHVILLVLSKDLGSALIFFLVYLFMVFAATTNYLYLFAGLGAGCVAGMVAYQLFYHVQQRVSAWRNPWICADGDGYQVVQSLFAIGTGGWLGLGLYQGLPESIPVVSKDFIFSAISEEMGGFFALSLVILCFSCFLIFIKAAMESSHLFYKLIALGLGISYAVQVILTVGGAIKFIPSTGVTLPLVSYGGSSMLSTMISFFIIQGICISNEKEKQVAEKARKEQEWKEKRRKKIPTKKS